jgi:hypothetical protein
VKTPSNESEREDLDTTKEPSMNGKADEGDAPTVGIDLSALALPQNFQDQLGVKKVLTTVPVRKPNKHSFVRVREGEGWRLTTSVLEFKEDNETFLVAPPLRELVATESFPVTIVTVIDRQGVLFLWPLKLPVQRTNAWHTSAIQAADMATKAWVRVHANMHLGAYEVYEAQGELGEPEWPDLTFQQIVNIGFKDRYIDSPDHPVLRRLRGEV